MVAIQIAIYSAINVSQGSTVAFRALPRNPVFAVPLNFCLRSKNTNQYPVPVRARLSLPVSLAHLIFANSLLILFSSSSRARAFLRSAINCTRPRMFALLLLERPRKPAAEEAILSYEEGLERVVVAPIRTRLETVWARTTSTTGHELRGYRRVLKICSIC